MAPEILASEAREIDIRESEDTGIDTDGARFNNTAPVGTPPISNTALDHGPPKELFSLRAGEILDGERLPDLPMDLAADAISILVRIIFR